VRTEPAWLFWALVGLATLLAATLRLHGIDSPSLWVDEFFSIGRAGVDHLHWTYALGYQPTRLSLWLTGADLGQVSLDNIVRWQALGVTERGARLGPAWVGIASVPLLGLLARPVLGGAVAGVAALFLAIVPYHIYWSQMARYYTTEFLFANAFLLLFIRAMQLGHRARFALAAVAGLLAFCSHFTAVFVVGACLAAVGVAWLLRFPIPHARTGVVALAGTVLVSALLLATKELAASQEASLGSFASQSWAPSLLTLVLGSVLRFEPVLIAAGLGWLLMAIRRRDAVGILIGVVAVLVPAGVLALKPFFPVGQRYYFACVFPWCLLAASWVVEVGRALGGRAGPLAAASALGVVCVGVGFNAYLYVHDGAGARTRWRDAYAHVLQHGGPADPVFVVAGGFQAQYYLEREAPPLASVADLDALVPGTWVIERSRGDEPSPHADRFELRRRFAIPSKPWSWVVNVLQVRER
jgi:hypothetical protein